MQLKCPVLEPVVTMAVSKDSTYFAAGLCDSDDIIRVVECDKVSLSLSLQSPVTGHLNPSRYGWMDGRMNFDIFVYVCVRVSLR